MPFLPDLSVLSPFSRTSGTSTPTTDPATDPTVDASNARTNSIGPSSLSGADDSKGDFNRLVKRRKVELTIPISGGVTLPKSQYANWQAPLPVCSEEQAISDLYTVWNSQPHTQKEAEHVTYELEDFSVYRPTGTGRHAGEFAPLHALTISKGATNELWFDGILRVGNIRRYVERVPFQEITVEGYGDDHVTSLSNNICLRSKLGRKLKPTIYYRLGQSEKSYERYFKPYLWIVHLGKFFVDFLMEIDADTEDVQLNRFRSQFHDFLAARYSGSNTFRLWAREYGSTDFRTAISANVGYLWKECCGLSHEEDMASLTDHSIWAELRGEAIPTVPTRFVKTVVTPAVFQFFKHMPFVSQIEALTGIDEAVTNACKGRRQKLKLTPLDHEATERPADYLKHASRYEKGQVICVKANNEPMSGWYKSTSKHWYAYVQAVKTNKSGKQKLELLWLYEPKDTTLGHGYYPFQNELFMSDNCSCGKGAVDAESEDLLGVVDVAWSSSPISGKFFVRRKYRTVRETGAYDFVTLQKSDFICGCKTELSDMDNVCSEYSVGDSVLVRKNLDRDESLEPAEIIAFSRQTDTVLLRDFEKVDGAFPNQLSVNRHGQTYSVSASHIIRRCYVRVFPSVAKVQAPFNRSGAGDHYFILDAITTTARSGPLPGELIKPTERLSGMGIFCGGGNFDRGLAEGGAVDFRYGVDWADNAMHTYRANLHKPESTQLFLGSVNDYLAMAILGSPDQRIAKVGDVQFLSAGSPCPGFSSLQPDKNSEESLRNCSLVAAVMSMVDLYTPQYMILENVPGLACHPKGRPDFNVFSQILCYLVATGYQVQQHLMDPRDYGSCQTRGRIFIIATAPGCTPPSQPPTTHSAEGVRMQRRQIGKASNGMPFGERKPEIAAFHSVSVADMMVDLPDISDGHVQTCISFPDHRSPVFEDSRVRTIFAQIPRWPHGMSFMRTYDLKNTQGRTPLGRRQIEGYAWQNKHRSAPNSRAYSRIRPHGPIGCITTVLRVHDAFCGRTLHWDQPRVITVMEARRAQGFPDEEVITGAPAKQWKIIGNSVDRKVALALGLSLGKAWLQTLRRVGDGGFERVGAMEGSSDENDGLLKVDAQKDVKSNAVQDSIQVTVKFYSR